MEPLLIWVGGKRWAVEHVAPLFAQFPDARLVEPFCGGLGLAMGLQPRTALLNDINPYLINFYQQVKDGLTIGIPFDNTETQYYAHRDTFNAIARWGVLSAERSLAAQLFYYLNRHCFRGLCRFNSAGEFNTAFGWRSNKGHHQATEIAKGNIECTELNVPKTFEEHRRVFANWTFTTGDCCAVELRPTDFIYCDPPYDVEFTKYNEAGFTWQDQERVAEWLSWHPGPVVLANQATDRIVDLYRSLGFELLFFDRSERMRSRVGVATGSRREVLALRNVTYNVENIGLFA